jgi:hypothetical protein
MRICFMENHIFCVEIFVCVKENHNLHRENRIL